MFTLGHFTKRNQFLEHFKHSLRIRRTPLPEAGSRERAAKRPPL